MQAFVYIKDRVLSMAQMHNFIQEMHKCGLPICLHKLILIPALEHVAKSLRRNHLNFKSIGYSAK